jgi:hypothetical protein
METFITQNRSCFEGPCITTGPSIPEESVWATLRRQTVNTINLPQINYNGIPNLGCIVPVQFSAFPEQPFGVRKGFISYVPPAFNAPTPTANTTQDLTIYQYQLTTYPSTGSSNNNQVILTGSSAITCSIITATTYNPYSADSTSYRSTFTRGLYNYIFTVTDEIVNEYEIYATPLLPNGQFSSQLELIATGIEDNITVINPTYFTP